MRSQSWSPKPKIAKKPNLAIVSAPKEIQTEETGTGSAVASKNVWKELRGLDLK